MQVTIKYTDDSSLTKEEIMRQCYHNYGNSAEVEIMPDSTKPHDLIYHAIRLIITHDQISMLFDNKLEYQKNIDKLRNSVLTKISEIADQVIIDNEERVTWHAEYTY